MIKYPTGKSADDVYIDQVWFKQGINVSKGMIRLWMNTMTEVVGADGEFTSKSRRVLVATQ